MPTLRPGVSRRRCVRCLKWVRVENLVGGSFGPDCARALGLVGDTANTGHIGPTLLDLLDEIGRGSF